MPPRKTVTASFPPVLFDRIEAARGRVPRSAWLQEAAERALEQETGTPGLSVRSDGGQGADPGPSPARPSDGQTTVDEMLASCPNCAGELTTVDISHGGLVTAQGALGCLACGYVREPENG